MKNFQLGEKAKIKRSTKKTFDREKLIKAFGRMGFAKDYEAKYVTVLRDSKFPFQRIVLPATNTIHIELLKLYAQDLRFDLNKLIYLFNSIPNHPNLT